MKEKKINIAYVVLHYMAIGETTACVDSIQKTDCGAKIVIIDNASTNGSGQLLLQRYGESDNFIVVINDENIGFSRANNLGCKLAKEKWDPDFYIVANNDIVFCQQDFTDKIEQIYLRTGFSILGPDIINTRNNNHQSPRDQDIPSLLRARITVILNTICYTLFCLTYPFLRKYYHNLRENAVDVPNYDKEQQGVLLSGSCVIFSRDYMNHRQTPFYPETFFFSEEALFSLWCKRNGKTIVYSPTIQVWHNESASTYLERDGKKRIKFQMRNIIDSTKIYIKELKKAT